MKRRKESQQKLKPEPANSPSDLPTGEMIASLAYSYWEQEGRPDGRDVEHWRRAEAQLRSGSIPEAPAGR